MKYIVTLNGNQYEVEVEEGQATANYIGKAAEQAPVEVAPTAAQATMPTPVPQAAPQPAIAGVGTPIVAPMPGTILKVNTHSGDAVKAGQILFILEAMKMENEIVAPKDGTITSVCVAAGDAVETDGILASIQ